MTKYPPAIICDFYKFGHAHQTPKDSEAIYETWTARDSRVEGVKSVIAFGFQGFIKEWLINYFNDEFFGKPVEEVIAQYERYVKFCLGGIPNSQHIKDLHNLGYLPLDIRAVEEGTRVPIRCPMLTIQNTHPAGYWFVGFLETLFSCEIWQPITTATIADEYRRILTDWSQKTCDDNSHLLFQAHDFSMRGMGGVYASAKSGAGHLLSFAGTDTVPAINYLERFYNADVEKELVGASIPATEHSVMEALGQDEYKAYKHLLTAVYPNGLMAVVSDTWDLWKVVTEVIPSLKAEIMARDGKVVLRPDSGDPIKIICGDVDSTNVNAKKGVIELLWEIFGGTINSVGYKVLDSHIGAIYGDSITLQRANEICRQLEAKGFASSNIVFGIGSYTYQYVTRDTFGMALKATYGVFGGEEKLLFKDPITDNGIKKSQKGMVCVFENPDKTLGWIDNLYAKDRNAFEDKDLLKPLFLNGRLLRDDSLSTIRNRIKEV